MPYLEFHRWILAAVLVMARFGGAFAICPALTESMIPGVARRWWMFGLVAAKEALLGALIGFFAAIPFWVAENVGNFIDNQRGATMGEVYSPLNGSQVSTTGIFFTQIVSTLFFVGGAVFIFLGALYKSYLLWPVFGDWGALAPGAGGVALGALDGMLRTTVVISAPVIILMFLATLGLGLVNRTAPQLNVFFLSMPVKSALATLGLGLVNRTAPQLNVFFLSMPVKSALGVAMLIIYVPFVLDMLMYTRDNSILDPLLRMLGS